MAWLTATNLLVDRGWEYGDGAVMEQAETNLMFAVTGLGIAPTQPASPDFIHKND